MRNICIKTLVIISFLNLAFPILAQTTRVIQLRDGSVLKGQVIELKDSIYTVKTDGLGLIQINEEDIHQITVGGNVQPQAISGDKQSGGLSADGAQLKSKVQMLQGSLLSDPGIMLDIQTLVQDEEVMRILSDENFVNDILSYDMQKIEQNEQLKQLLDNTQMQNLIKKINTKMENKE